MGIRSRFKEQTLLASQPFREGDTVLCRGEKAVLSEIRQDGGCSITFGSGVSEKCVQYASITKEANSGRVTKQPCARLEHLPPSLRPNDRQARADCISADVKKAVQDIYESGCATSPHQRDSVFRRLSRHVVERAQALIMTSTFQELYQTFQRVHVGVKLSYAMFKRLAPWNLKRAYRETCVCRCCEEFRLYKDALHTVADLLAPLIPSPEECNDVEEADEDSGDTTSEQDEPAPELVRLHNFCKLSSKSKMADGLVCGGNLHTAERECIRGNCPSCGFNSLWSGPTGLRRQLVDSNGMLQPGIAPAWQVVMKWETLKSAGSTPSDGSCAEEKNGLRERREGSPIEFLDDFETASLKLPAHKYLVSDVKRALTQRDQNFWPGMLVANYDWSENGTILNAIQIQSEYWSLVHYSLFICITSHLVDDAWRSRSSHLPVGTEVTVEPEGNSIPNSLEPAAGSHFAVVKRCPSQEDAGHPTDIYLVQSGSVGELMPVPRDRLRHRKLHTVAFVCITDDKRHDAISTQHMLREQFKYWKEHHDQENPFWGWIGHSDNASHFKSGSMLNFWSRVRNGKC